MPTTEQPPLFHSDGLHVVRKCIASCLQDSSINRAAVRARAQDVLDTQTELPLRVGHYVLRGAIALPRGEVDHFVRIDEGVTIRATIPLIRVYLNQGRNFYCAVLNTVSVVDSVTVQETPQLDDGVRAGLQYNTYNLANYHVIAGIMEVHAELIGLEL